LLIKIQSLWAERVGSMEGPVVGLRERTCVRKRWVKRRSFVVVRRRVRRGRGPKRVGTLEARNEGIL
jgi:hypothetical protein